MMHESYQTLSRLIKLVLIICISLSALTSCTEGNRDRGSVTAKKGVLDLGQWDFPANGIVELNGEWEFYWNRLIPPADFSSGKITVKPDHIDVPDIWDDFQYHGERVGGQGFATYRLKVKLPASEEMMGLKLLSLSTAYRLWINGELKASAGQPGKNRNAMTPEYKPQVITFQPRQKTLDIVFHISNFHHRDGGLWEHIDLGPAHQILNRQNRKAALEHFLAGCLFIMALYHFGLFWLRRNERSTFYFSLICLLWSIDSMLSGEIILKTLFPGMDYSLLVRCEYLSLYLSLPLFAFFLNSLFREEFSFRVLQVTTAYYLVINLMIVFTPPLLFTNVATPGQVYMMVFGFYAIFVLVRAYRHNKTGAGWFIAGGAVLLLTSINDFLHNHYFIITGNYRAFGLFFFILSQSFVISTRFSKMFQKVEDMSLQLEDLNLSLETKVEKRTEELLRQNSRMNELLHILSHDLCNPLSGIKGFLELKDLDPEGFKDNIGFIELAVDNCIGVIDMVREMKALEEGKKTLEIQPHRLRNLMDESIIILSQTIKKKNLTLTIDCDPEIKVLVEKTSFINSVFSNIISNAVKFSYPGSEIRVSAISEDHQVMLRIQDQGMGIPENILKELFEINKSTNRKGTEGERGTGFGMPLVKRFVSRYGGDITVRSTVHSNDPPTGETEVILKLKAA